MKSTTTMLSSKYLHIFMYVIQSTYILVNDWIQRFIFMPGSKVVQLIAPGFGHHTGVCVCVWTFPQCRRWFLPQSKDMWVSLICLLVSVWLVIFRVVFFTTLFNLSYKWKETLASRILKIVPYEICVKMKSPTYSRSKSWQKYKPKSFLTLVLWNIFPVFDCFVWPEP